MQEGRPLRHNETPVLRQRSGVEADACAEPCVQTKIVAVAYWKGTNKRKGEERVQKKKKKKKKEKEKKEKKEKREWETKLW